MAKAELVWTFKGGNLGGDPGYAEATLARSDDRDQPHYIIAAGDVPDDIDMYRMRDEYGDLIAANDPVGFARHVLNSMGLEKRS